MVQCKEEVFDWFKDLSGATRIELMCGLLNLCIPLEWRFFATVIENLARRDYASLKDYEIKANSAQELEEIANSNWLLRGDEQDTRASTAVSTPSVDKQQPVSSSSDTSLNSIRSKIVVYMCLLSSSNRVCATLIHKSILKQLCVENLQQTLAQAKKSEKLDSPDAGFLSDNLYNEIILLYTLARFHPAFTFEQQAVLGQQLQFVQHWMDAVKLTAAAASGTIPARHPLSHFQQHLSQYQQTQQFHHPFQSTNKQQHPQYHHQMQQQQYSSHLHPPNDYNQQIANMSLPNNSLSVLPPYTLQLTVASPPGFENQSLSPGVPDYSPMVGVEQKPGRKDATKDSLLESDEELMRGVTKELRSLSFGERVEKDSTIVTNGDLNEYKKSNLDNSKPNSPLDSICSSSSSSPVSSASNSLNGAIVSQQHLTQRHIDVENLLKRENLRKYKEKIMSITNDELWKMSEDEFVKLGLSGNAATKLHKALARHSNYNGLRLHNSGEADISDSLPQRSSSPSVSPSVSFCSEKGFDGVGDTDERVATYLKTQDASVPSRASSGTKVMSNQKWSAAYNKAVPNVSTSASSVSTLASTNKQQTASKSSSLSSASTGSETSAKASKTLELSAAGSTGSNRVPWKSVSSAEASVASVNKCANCGSSNCICSVSNGSSVATTPSSTPPPAIPNPQIQPGMVHMAGGQSMIHPYWLFLAPPPPFPSAMNGYSPGSHSEFLNWYTLAVAAASAGMYWPQFSSSLAFPGSIPGFPSTASVHGGNQSFMAGGNSQSKVVSCYNCGGIGHRGNECSQQSLDDVVKPSTFNMNFTTPPEFDAHVSSHTVHHSTYPNQAPHMQSAPHLHQASFHYSTSPPHNFQEHSSDRSASRHGTHPHT